MSEPRAFFFHDRESPELANCEKCGGDAWLCNETNSYDRSDKTLWVHVRCNECNHQMSCSGLLDDTNSKGKLLYDLAEQVVSQWNKKPFKFRLKFRPYIVPN